MSPFLSSCLTATQLITITTETLKHMKERAKDTFGVVLRGDLVWRMLEKGKGSKAPSSAELTPFAASKDAIQRSRLARESTELREKEEADRAKRLAVSGFLCFASCST